MTLSSCARAATAAETRYRIDRPIAPARAARIFALDVASAQVVRRIAQLGWANARLYICEAVFELGDGRGGWRDEVLLRRVDGPSSDGASAMLAPAMLTAELVAADVAVVIATGDAGDAGRIFAAAIGRACGKDGIMTAGLVLGGESPDESPAGSLTDFPAESPSQSPSQSPTRSPTRSPAEAAVAALRPYARVLLPSANEDDLIELLTALRV